MIPRRSLVALAIAIGAHLLLLWPLLRWEKRDDAPRETTRPFGLHLNPEPTLAETLEAPPPSQPQARSETPKPLSKPLSAPVKAPDPKTAEPVSPSEPLPVTEPQLYTPADLDQLPRSVIHHYGERFFDLSAGEQRYIIDNLQRIRKINEVVGTRLLRERPDDEVDPDDSNIIEFTLYPDGTISDLHLQKERVGTLLDELTLQTINLAHPKYPQPTEPTLIRIRVFIIVK